MELLSLKTKTFSIQELDYLNELLASGLPLQTCLNLIEDKRNNKIIKIISKKLNEGKIIEEIIFEYIPTNIKVYLKGLINKLSFMESLHLSLQFYRRKNNNFNILQKKLSYPLILLFCCLSALFLFDKYGLNTIISLLKSFDVDFNLFKIFRYILRFLVYLIYLCFVLLAIAYLYFKNPKRIGMFYLFISKYAISKYLKMYYCSEFMEFYNVCKNAGYNSRDILEILRSLKDNPVISLLAFHLSKKLLEGETLSSASNQDYFDPLLGKFLLLGSYAKNFSDIVDNYIVLSRYKIENFIKMFTAFVQFSSYTLIGFAIIFIYQVMFLPMQAIVNF